ncbi:MAG TPA: helix-turn-helix domain-containing protein, partial [Thermoplasmata archaeon]|nr:helix-turn-helix domain-containing protein [Thermoplasmata archaeon]
MSASGGRLLEMLVEHGIPERAARIYLAACREGPQTAAELARITALNRVEAYRFIRHLEVLGLLRATHKRPMRFEPLPPAELIDRWIRGASERLRRLEVDREAALADASEGLLDVESADPRKFAVLEGDAPIARFMVRRIGTARSGIDGVVPASSLPFLTEGGIDRALKDAHARGVRVRITTEVTLANRSEARSLGSFAEVRHSHRPVAHQSWTIDRQGALLYLAAAESLRGPPATR